MTKMPQGMMDLLVNQALIGNKMIAAGNNSQQAHIEAADKATPTGKRTIRTTTRGGVNGYIGGGFWVSIGDRDNPHTVTLAAEFLAGGL
jgi:hypothetical protein